MSETTEAFLELVVASLPFFWVICTIVAIGALAFLFIMACAWVMPGLGDLGQNVTIALCILAAIIAGWLASTYLLAVVAVWIGGLS